jgi:hypothetical protein
MGQDLMRRAPKFVHGFIDRHGKPRLREDDPTRDVKAIRIKSDGYHSWNDDEIAQFEKRHPVGTPARLALALLLYTGHRRSDVVRMGPQHIRNGMFSVRQ